MSPQRLERVTDALVSFQFLPRDKTPPTRVPLGAHLRLRCAVWDEFDRCREKVG